MLGLSTRYAHLASRSAHLQQPGVSDATAAICNKSCLRFEHVKFQAQSAATVKWTKITKTNMWNNLLWFENCNFQQRISVTGGGGVGKQQIFCRMQTVFNAQAQRILQFILLVLHTKLVSAQFRDTRCNVAHTYDVDVRSTYIVDCWLNEDLCAT